MYSCEGCSKNFSRNDNLDRHKRHHCEFEQEESSKYKFRAPTKVMMGGYDNKDDDVCGKKPLGGTFLTPEESLLWRKVYSKDKDIKEVMKEFKKQMNYSKGSR